MEGRTTANFRCPCTAAGQYIVFLWAAGHSAQAPGTHKAEKEDRDDLARSAKSADSYLISHASLRGGSGIN